MKKTLIALTVATSAFISGSAMAWSEGNFNGSVDFGGSVTVGDNFAKKWSWEVGTTLGGFDGNAKELTDSGKKLVITADKDAAILLGKTVNAFMAKDVGSSAIPQIAFSDHAKAKVTPVFDKTGGAGKGYLDVPVLDDKSVVIGKAKINMTAAGVRLLTDTPNKRAVVASLYSADSNYIFFGGIPSDMAGSLQRGSTTADWIASVGGLTLAELRKQISDVDADITGLGVSSSAYRDNMTGSVKSASYAMAVKSGQTLDLTFTDAVTTTTAWKAPLNISVTYQ